MNKLFKMLFRGEFKKIELVKDENEALKKALCSKHNTIIAESTWLGAGRIREYVVVDGKVIMFHEKHSLYSMGAHPRK